MKHLITVLVFDYQKDFPEISSIFEVLPQHINLLVVSELSSLPIIEDNLTIIIFSCKSKTELEDLLKTLDNLLSVIVVVDDVDKGEELIESGASNYLIKNLINKEILLQIINNTIKLKNLADILKNNYLSHKRHIEKLTKDFDSFTYRVSHDLRSPLRAITSLSEWIEEDLADTVGQETKKNLNLLRERTKRLGFLIDGILQYSRVGRISTPIELIDVNDLLAELICLKIDKPTEFSIEIQPNMPKFYTESERLGQVFLHLIKNAIDFHDRSDGIIKILVQEKGDFYQFTVADDGLGIALENHQKIFEIFYTLSTNSKLESVGIGLALVKKIVELFGGNIWVESTLGKGSAFHFLWPKHLEI